MGFGLLPQRSPRQNHPDQLWWPWWRHPGYNHSNYQLYSYGPSLAPADRYSGQITEVAAAHTSSLHELATLMSCTADPCECWETPGYGRAATLYRRTQTVLEASRQVPAHRRVEAFVLQPVRILMCLPYLERIGNSTNATRLYAPTKFHVFFSTSTDAVWAWCPGHH